MSASIEPVAWMFDEEGFTTDPDQGGTPLYTADQLREAKVEVLQELLRRIVKTGNHVAVEASLMADELEKQTWL